MADGMDLATTAVEAVAQAAGGAVGNMAVDLVRSRLSSVDQGVEAVSAVEQTPDDPDARSRLHEKLSEVLSEDPAFTAYLASVLAPPEPTEPTTIVGSTNARGGQAGGQVSDESGSGDGGALKFAARAGTWLGITVSLLAVLAFFGITSISDFGDFGDFGDFVTTDKEANREACRIADEAAKRALLSSLDREIASDYSEQMSKAAGEARNAKLKEILAREAQEFGSNGGWADPRSKVEDAPYAEVNDEWGDYCRPGYWGVETPGEERF
ncbi:hypothetical protein [Streptomyces platensis]|uniref:hypothetical protein n=1 Tax=Streptomyces platensis TaxID=58346 RepID=UPI001F1818AD|nr:hypothetical protein [Streptomyces platensis]MCF3143805.1 hypothetical protein [Streptomyces platensis]